MYPDTFKFLDDNVGKQTAQVLFHFYDGFWTGVDTGGDKFRIAGLDPIVTQFMYLIGIGKAFATFSIMFGFSFFHSYGQEFHER